MKRTNESLIAFSNRVFGLHVSEELAAMRDAFCPSKHFYHCSNTCPIYNTYLITGLSCNQALDRYPDVCVQLIEKGVMK